MDKKAARPHFPPPPGNEEKSFPMPASASRNNTQEDQAQTHHPIQPRDYFLGGERTTSPPPGGLEKVMDPSLRSPPDTPAASSISSPSRSSTLNSFSTTQSQESNTTIDSTSSDDTVSVPRSLSFPAMGSHPADHKSLSKGETIRMVQFPVISLYHLKHTAFPLRIGVPVPLPQYSSGHNNTHPTWPDDQSGGPAPNNQAPPSRHLTFPIGGPRNLTKFEDSISFMPEGDEDRTISESSRPGDPLSEDSGVDIPNTDVESRSLETQTDAFLESRMNTSEERWMIGSLHSRQPGLQCQLPPDPSSLLQRRKSSRRNRPMSNARRGLERTASLASQHCHAGTERSCSPCNTVFNVFNDPSTITNSEATAEPENFSRNEPQNPEEEIKESHSPSLSLRNKPRGESKRESSSQDSDDDSSFRHEDCSPSNEEEDDLAYDQLVESITNLVLESSCVGNVEERAVPVKHYVHNFLEQILNHPKPAAKPQILSLPIQEHPMGENDAPCDAGEPGHRGRGQSGNGGSSSANKRKNKEAPGSGRYRGNGDEDDLGDSSGEGCSNNSQEDKKQKTGRDGGKLSCPFRKRNPIRFNVRSHQSCALNGFADLALLKRHIKASHQKTSGSKKTCFRCKETFADQAALKHHLIQPESCSLRNLPGNDDPEDGISEEVEQALKERARVRSVDSWESLWELLFPQDERIPKPYHEPPVELEELQDHFYQGDSVSRFIHQQAMDCEAGIPDHGFRYIVKGLWECRDAHSHDHSEERLELDRRFEHTVHNAFRWRQTAPQAQQTPSMVVSNAPQGIAPSLPENVFDPSLQQFWLDDPGLYANLSPWNPIEPNHVSHPGANGFQVPASTTLFPSSDHGSTHHPAPQYAPTTVPYRGPGMLPQPGNPCPAAEGSAHHSSGPSSQSLDSSYQTQETQDTPYTQQSAAAFDHHHQPYPNDGRPCDHGGACSCCSTSPVGIPGQVSSAQNLWGVGTKPVTRTAECLRESKSDEDLGLGPVPDMS